MKKLILIACLSVMGIIIPGDEYPYLSSHLPPKSPVRLQCEENGTAEWGDELKEAIAARCQNLENTFPRVVKYMDQHIPEWVKQTSSEVDLLLIKRDLIRENWLTKKNIALIRDDVSIILEPLKLSEADVREMIIREEVDSIKAGFLMTAEEGLRD